LGTRVGHVLTGQDNRPVAIVVTEVDTVVRMTTADLLIDAGFRTVEARDAREALALLAAHESVRLLITGRSLPGGIDGFRLAHIAHDRWPSLGIILTTGGFAPAAGALPPGARLLLKPYKFEDLVEAVKHLMPEEDEVDQAAPFVPQGLTSTHSALGGTGAGEVAAPMSEPDKS
jgi:DNA-binding NtrC family response regulator